jgi:hypothetical protein
MFCALSLIIAIYHFASVQTGSTSIINQALNTATD